MKQTTTKKSQARMWKYILTLCVAILGFGGFSFAQNYPFPQNYAYPNGQIYTGSNVQSRIQSLYNTWLEKYYVPGTVNGQPAGRIKFVQAGESGVNTVSEGIAYGMLIFVYMDNATNDTQDKFDRLWRYYKANSNAHGVMNWKVNNFTGKVTSGDGNANGATDAELDVAQALLLAHKQWGSNGAINYLSEAKSFIDAIWNYEVNPGSLILKPGDAFEDYYNPCYFIFSALGLFDQVQNDSEVSSMSWPKRNWSGVIDACYSLMEKSANASTGLIPDWCYGDGSYLSGLKDGKFESIFGYDAVRIPWRLAHGYAWFGHSKAQALASKITTWVSGKYPSPDGIKDGYTLNGNVGTGGLGGSLASWGTSSNACFKGGLSIGSMVDSKFSTYMNKCWESGSAIDGYGAYYTHTTQLLFMMCLTGNMPNFWDMKPSFVSAVTNSTGDKITLNVSKPLSNGGSASDYTIKTYADESDATPTTVSVGSLSVSGKVVTLNLSTEVAEPIITISYNGTTMKGTDNSVGEKFADKEVTNMVTNMEPYVISRYTDLFGSTVCIQWSKELNPTSFAKANFSVTAGGVAKTIESVGLSAEDPSILELKFESCIVENAKTEVTVSFTGSAVTSTIGTRTAKAFTNAEVKNYYMSVECYNLVGANWGSDNVTLAEAWPGCLKWGTADEVPAGSAAEGITKAGHFTGNGTQYGSVRNTTAVTDPDFLAALMTKGATLKTKIYVETNAGNEDIRVRFQDIKYQESYDANSKDVTIPVSGEAKGQWIEYEVPIGTPAAGHPYSQVIITGSNADAATGSTIEFFIASMDICPPAPTVTAENGRLLFDGSQIELRMSAGMKIPSPAALVVKSGTTVCDIASIEAKMGDPSMLVINLENAIESASANVTVSYTNGSASQLKAIDGRQSETFTCKLANLYGVTVTTGWFDDFDNAKDYITGELGAPIGETGWDLTENASSSLITLTQGATVGYAGATIVTYDPKNNDQYAAKYVLDLTGRETIEVKYRINGTLPSKLYYRIDLTDLVNGYSSDGMAFQEVTPSTSWQTLTYDMGSYMYNKYSFAQEVEVDRTNIRQIMFYFVTDVGSEANDYAPTAYKGKIEIDYIKIGLPLSLSLSAKEVDQDATITGTSTTDGYIYIVPGDTKPQYSAMEEAVVAGKGKKVTCTKGTAASISLKGLGYGFFYGYAFDPASGAFSSNVQLDINDVTPPEFQTWTEDEIVAANGQVFVSIDEDGEIHVVPADLDMNSFDPLNNEFYVIRGMIAWEEKTLNVADWIANGYFKEGDSFKFVAVDGSGNVSEEFVGGPDNEGILISQLPLGINDAYVERRDEKGELYTDLGGEIGETIVVLATRPGATAYLVHIDKIDGVSAATINTLAAATADMTKTQQGRIYTSSLAAGRYYVYLLEGSDLVGPSSALAMLPSTAALDGWSIFSPLSKECNIPTGETTSVIIKVDPAKVANTELELTYDNTYFTVEKTDVSTANGQITLEITGVAATPSAQTVTVVAKEFPEILPLTFTVNVTQALSGIKIEGPTKVLQESQTTFIAIPLPVGMEFEKGVGVSWSVSGNTGVSIDQSGTLTVGPSAEGTATITATCGDFKATHEVTIVGRMIDAVEWGDVKISEISSLSNKSASAKTLIAISKITYGGVEYDVSSSYMATLQGFGLTTDNDVTFTVECDNPNVTASSSKGQWFVSLFQLRVKYPVNPTTPVGDATFTITAVSNPDVTFSFTVKDLDAAQDIPVELEAPTTAEIPNVSVCAGDQVTITATLGASETAVWYESATSTTKLATTNSFKPTGVTATTTYYVARATTTDESADRLPVTVTVNAVPTISFSGLNASYCSNDAAVTLAATPAGGSFTVAGTPATTFNPATAAASSAVVYSVETAEGCSASESQTVTVTAAPTITVTAPATACAGEEVTLPGSGTWSGTGVTGAKFVGSVADTYSLAYTEGTTCKSEKDFQIVVTKPAVPVATSASVNVGDAVPALTATGTSIKWYESEAATTAVATTASYTPTASTAAEAVFTYYVTNTESGCESGKVPVTLTVSSCTTPAPVIGAVEAVCEGGTMPTLSATGTDINWYNVATGGIPTAGATFTPAAAGTYYASQTDGCEGPRASVTVVVNPKPATPVLTAANSCAGAEFNALASDVAVDWYADKAGAPVSATAARSFTPSTITTTTTYYAKQTVGGCASDWAEVAYTINAKPAAPVATPASACLGETDQYVLSATGTALQWYDNQGSKQGTAASQTVAVSTAKAYDYTVTQTVDGCTSDAATVTLTVNELPAIQITVGSQFCSDSDESVALSATPAGGSFTLDAAPATSFTPSALSAATHNVGYTYTDAVTTCSNTATAQFEVVTCSEPAVTDIKLDVTTLSMIVGDIQKLKATLTPATGTLNQAISWFSSNTDVVAVDNKGNVTAKGAGTAVITVKSDYTAGIETTCNVTVSSGAVAVESVSFAAGLPTSLETYQNIDLNEFVVINPAGATAPEITFSVDNNTAVSLDEGLLMAEMVNADTEVEVTVTVTAGGVTKTATAIITIKEFVAPATLVNNIFVTTPSRSYQKGETFTAVATVYPANADDKTVTWSVTGAGVAGVNINPATGEVEITEAAVAGTTFSVVATANDASAKTGSADVKIIDKIVPVESISFDANGVYEISETGSLDLNDLLKINPADATVANVSWTIISGFRYADLTEGVISGKKGTLINDFETVTISCVVNYTESNGSTGTKQVSQDIKVTRNKILVTEITIDSKLSIEEGDTQKLTATLKPAIADDRTVTWSIKSGAANATIDPKTGEITATGSQGFEFVVIATANDAGQVVSNECTVTIVEKVIPIKGFVLSSTELTVEKGTPSTFTVSFNPENTNQTLFDVIPSSADISCEAEGNTVRVAGNKGGVGTITIRSKANPSITKTVTVTVIEKIQNITIKGGDEMLVGKTMQLAAVVEPQTATNKQVTWSSENTTVAAVSPTGLVTAISPGSVAIKAIAADGSGIESMHYITVEKVPVSEIIVKGFEIEFGKTATIRATVAPAQASYPTLNFSSSDPSVLEVDAQGNVTALAEGTATVTVSASQDPVSKTITITVTPVLADKSYLYQCMENPVWGAWAIWDKYQRGVIVVHPTNKGAIRPVVLNEFQNAWVEAQDVYESKFATQKEVDKAARALYDAIVAMGEIPELLPQTAVEEVQISAKVFPTMASTVVTIEADNMIAYKVVSSAGKVVAIEQVAADQVEINVSQFAVGQYSVIIETANGIIAKSFFKK